MQNNINPTSISENETTVKKTVTRISFPLHLLGLKVKENLQLANQQNLQTSNKEYIIVKFKR